MSVLDKETLVEFIVHHVRGIYIWESLLPPSLYEEIPYACQICIGLVLQNIMLKTHVKYLSSVSFSTSKNSLVFFIL